MTTKEKALTDLKDRYGKYGDPLYMSGISAIKNHYKNLLSIDDIRNFLATSRTYTTHYNYKPVKHNPYYVRRLRQMFQMDLTEVSQIREYNDGYNYLLVVIDCFSRKIWVRLLKRKTSEEVLSKLQSILNESGNPKCIVSDRGSEFINKDIKKWSTEQGITLRNPYNLGKAPHVERVQATLQNLIYKHITSTMNFRFIDKLQSFVNTYNNRRHRMTKLSPEDGEQEKNGEHIRLMHEDYYNKVKPTKRVRFKAGMTVRIARLEPKFGRGYDKKSPEQIYRISKVITKFPRVLYELSTLDGKEDIQGTFYQEQLTKVIDQEEYIIEKVLRKNKGKALVKFLGYDEPEWIPVKNITSIKEFSSK